MELYEPKEKRIGNCLGVVLWVGTIICMENGIDDIGTYIESAKINNTVEENGVNLYKVIGLLVFNLVIMRVFVNTLMSFNKVDGKEYKLDSIYYIDEKDGYKPVILTLENVITGKKQKFTASDKFTKEIKVGSNVSLGAKRKLHEYSSDAYYIINTIKFNKNKERIKYIFGINKENTDNKVLKGEWERI